MVWNVAGELVSPKNITIGSKDLSSGSECHFPLVSLLYPYIIILSSQVYFSKYFLCTNIFYNI